MVILCCDWPAGEVMDAQRTAGRCEWRAWVSQWRDGTEAVVGYHRYRLVKISQAGRRWGEEEDCHGIGRG